MKINQYCATLVMLLCLIMFANSVNAQKGFKKLIWSDEFNSGSMPDTNKWGYDTAMGCPNNCGWGNNELEYYSVARPENSRIENGLLVIEARREAKDGAAFTSARLLTRNKFQFTYGRVEARAKLPAGVGTWPAIWMLGANVFQAGWPESGELDIMEHRGRDLDKIFGTLHYPVVPEKMQTEKPLT
jgi:beta-glucanase (GH16 family)